MRCYRPIILAAAFLTCVSFSNADAHIVAGPNSATAGAWFKTALRVTHGCDGESTTAVIVTIPDGVTIIRPQAKAGWTIQIDKKKLAIPVTGPHGNTIDTVTTQITWSGNTLADAHFDEFGLTMKLPEQAGPLAFPVTQKCITKSTKWHDVGDTAHGHHAHPAPVITVLPKN